MPYFPGLDAIRWAVVIVSLALAFAVGVRWRRERRRGVYLALAVYAAVGAVQMLDTMGRPMYAWRLPVLAAAAVTALCEMGPRAWRDWRDDRTRR